MLLTSQRPTELEAQLPSTEASDVDSVETLRQILIRQGQRELGYQEAQEIGTALIDFYQVLAEDAGDEPTA